MNTLDRNQLKNQLIPKIYIILAIQGMYSIYHNVCTKYHHDGYFTYLNGKKYVKLSYKIKSRQLDNRE